jgi:uncharacterized OB-fold protein
MTDITLPPSIANVEQVQSIRTPIRMEYTYTPGRALTQYLRAMKDKKILGGRCPDTGDVYVPPRGVSPTSGRNYDELVEVADVGHIKSFCVTHLPIPGRDDLELPYISAWVIPDGATVGFIGLVKGIPHEECRVGLRVKAVWKPDNELEESAENIPHWEPSGEPDHNVGGAK